MEKSPTYLARIAAVEKHMRALHAELDPTTEFDRFVNRFELELLSLREDLKERKHRASTGLDLDAERKRVFEMVQNKEHWKYPIDATLDELSEADENLLYDAIPHYTGSTPTIRRYKNGKVKVTAAGYFRTIGS